MSVFQTITISIQIPQQTDFSTVMHELAMNVKDQRSQRRFRELALRWAARSRQVFDRQRDQAAAPLLAALQQFIDRLHSSTGNPH